MSISKNKAPPLLLQRVDWGPFRYCHYFYYHSQCLKTKIEFVFGGVVLADSPKVFPLPKMKPLPVLLKELSCVHLEITIVLTITANV